MAHAPRNSSEADIQALEDFCERLTGFGADIAVEWLDGALTAVAASRRAVAMDEWLEPLLGDAFERAYGDPESAAEGRTVLQRRLAVLLSQLDAEALTEAPEDLRLAPLMVSYDDAVRAEVVAEGHLSVEEAEQMLQTGALWAEGFQAGVEALPEDWLDPDLDTDEGRWYDECLARIYALTLPPAELAEYLAEGYPGETLDRDQLVDEASFAVQDLRVHWLDHAPKPETRRVEATPGRNDPCPCGSGKKYKKCHGA